MCWTQAIKTLFKKLLILTQNPKGCPLASTIYSIFPGQKRFSWKTCTWLPKDVHLRCTADYPIWANRPYLTLNLTSNPPTSQDLICLMNFHIKWQYFNTKPDPRPNDACPWSEELSGKVLYKDAAQLFEEEQEDLMNTSELPVTLHTSFEYKQTVKKFKQRNCFNHYQNSLIYKLLET